ncbi:hypothetical protein SAMN05720473_101794 [Fibrobacter sp. UWB15]|jgi:hypothetical protein|uniref:hypothetical protein n=1 Tax=unclassified Fibrobacter TaxID=2634177 RepID=UPI00091C0F17|nr:MULTISPECIES: hypothetical protein [unclassified Fibrobacter]MDD5942054.1 hypothetical protein [Fibrobacter sp.]PWJ67911.1 hypothetical protein BGW99_101795 [Fibrobacter sp. UWB6]SHF81790.1 hypothetical protein SAMN05720760_101760 [Fibrobacter sp. UWB8]SMG16201.1 hypothetical protein SAMN05720473_101794 [Fibrobacter sp. UWB15]
MNDLENDPILNASSINSEDYWFLKLNNKDLQNEQNQDSNTAGQVDGQQPNQ